MKLIKIKFFVPKLWKLFLGDLYKENIYSPRRDGSPSGLERQRETFKSTKPQEKKTKCVKVALALYSFNLNSLL